MGHGCAFETARIQTNLMRYTYERQSNFMNSL
jgi:hypothetical protein